MTVTDNVSYNSIAFDGRKVIYLLKVWGDKRLRIEVHMSHIVVESTAKMGGKVEGAENYKKGEKMGRAELRRVAGAIILMK